MRYSELGTLIQFVYEKIMFMIMITETHDQGAVIAQKGLESYCTLIQE